LQRVAVSCIVLQCVAVCYKVVRGQPHIDLGHVTHCTCDCDMVHVQMQFVTHSGHVTHMSKSWHAYACVMSHSHVTHGTRTHTSLSL